MKKIMVVEDEVILTMAIRKTLENAGYSVLEPILSGEDAIEKVQILNPDLIVMDVTLQGEKDGIEVTNEIKQMLDVPIIMTTAHSDAATVERIQQSSSDGFLLKPINFTELIDVVKLNLEKEA